MSNRNQKAKPKTNPPPKNAQKNVNKNDIKKINDIQIEKEDNIIFKNINNENNNISLPTFTRAINQVKKILIDNNIILINETLGEALIKNYDIITKNILNSNKSQNTKRAHLNNILLILRGYPKLSFADYVKFDTARKQIKIS
tara:strand:- start:1318 stop:1746 length:429 start_codon:yes stop_codon:yes gene_type:complete